LTAPDQRPLVLYRYRTRAHREWLGDECTRLAGMIIELQEFQIRRWTGRGVWIWDDFNRREKWVSLHTRIAFAYVTKELALDSFKHRNAKHIGYLKRDLRAAVMARKAANNEDLWQPASPFDKRPPPRTRRFRF